MTTENWILVGVWALALIALISRIVYIERKGIKSYIKSTYSNITALTLRQIYRRFKQKIKLNKNKQTIMRKRVLDISLSKRGFENLITIKAVPEIEDYFKRAAGDKGTELSSKWLNSDGDGLTFYKKSEKLTGKVSGYGPVMDNFGNGLTDDGGRINLALLRIVGISGENGVTIQTDDLLGYEETKQYIEALGSWTKAFYEDNLRDQDLTASITFEV